MPLTWTKGGAVGDKSDHRLGSRKYEKEIITLSLITPECRQHKGFVVRRLYDAVKMLRSKEGLRTTAESLSGMPASEMHADCEQPNLHKNTHLIDTAHRS